MASSNSPEDKGATEQWMYEVYAHTKNEYGIP